MVVSPIQQRSHNVMNLDAFSRHAFVMRLHPRTVLRFELRISSNQYVNAAREQSATSHTQVSSLASKCHGDAPINGLVNQTRISRLEHAAPRTNNQHFCSTCAVFLISILTMLSCGSHVESVTRAAPRPLAVAPKVRKSSEIVVVVTIDGVRWQDVFRGVDRSLGHNLGPEFATWQTAEALTPNLHRMAMAQGVLLGDDAAPMVASSPSTVSLPGYSEIFSGRSPTCANNDCPATIEPTLLDEWTSHDTSAQLTILSSWSRIPRAAAKDLSRMTVSSGQSIQVHPERFCNDARLCLQYHGGRNLPAWPGTEDYRPDQATAALALAYLEVHQPQFLFLGLGDTDEHAHHGDYRSYLQALHAADATLGAIGRWLEEKEQQGHRTLLICTADHGRSHGFNHHGGAPEAARVWALFTGSVVAAHKATVASTARLADIAPTVRTFVGLPRDTRTNAGQSLFAKLGGMDPSTEALAIRSRE